MNKRKSSQSLELQYISQGSCCFYCKTKIKFEDITRDHFYPKSKGNTLFQNKVFACRFCNSSKGDKSIEEFRESILNIIKTKIISDSKISIYERIIITLDQIVDKNNLHEIILS
jgi:5-methylcytosine-specific restriction endonuclease McrA